MPDTSRTGTNLLIAAVAGAGVFFVLRNPSLRRFVWQTLRTGLSSTLPAFLLSQGRGALNAAGQSS